MRLLPELPAELVMNWSNHSRMTGQSVYYATKAFVLSFTEAIRPEAQDTNVTITALQPGPINTNCFQKADTENFRIVKEGSLPDLADVDKDGYEALLAGEDRMVSGFRNKVQVAKSNLIPKSLLAETVKKQQKPSDQN